MKLADVLGLMQKANLSSSTPALSVSMQKPPFPGKGVHDEVQLRGQPSEIDDFQHPLTPFGFHFLKTFIDLSRGNECKEWDSE